MKSSFLEKLTFLENSKNFGISIPLESAKKSNFFHNSNAPKIVAMLDSIFEINVWFVYDSAQSELKPSKIGNFVPTCELKCKRALIKYWS